MRLLLMALCIVVCTTCYAGSKCSDSVLEESTHDFGHFDGKITATWEDDGRNMILERDFAYIDHSGKTWIAPKDSQIDGASIPACLWSVVGGPYEGKYRNASVVHDVACNEKNEKWEDVHRMFYEACRCGGVDEATAQCMYWAVYNYGPHWPAAYGIASAESSVEAAKNSHRYSERTSCQCLATMAKTYFQTHKLSLEDVEKLTPEQLAASYNQPQYSRRWHRLRR